MYVCLYPRYPYVRVSSFVCLYPRYSFLTFYFYSTLLLILRVLFYFHPPSVPPSLAPSFLPPFLPQVEDVARAFEVILHRGVTGKIYNIGGTNEKANIEVAKDLIRLMGHEQAEEKMLNFVEDRAFNGM